MAMGRRQRRAAEKRHRGAVRLWVAGHWLIVAMAVAATLLANGFLIFADEWASTCSGYVSPPSKLPFDPMSGFHQCHKVLGLEIPTQWNPAIALAFSLVGAGLGSVFEDRTPPPAPAPEDAG